MKFAKYWKSIETKVGADKYLIDPQTGKPLDPDSTFTIWGASNKSPESAMQRAKERLKIFEKLVKSEFTDKSDYEYGFIREEVIEEILADDGSMLAVLTRNNYGAIVLNTETVMFGDVDVDEEPPGFLGRLFGSVYKDKAFYINKIEQYQKDNPKLSIIVYETFAGLRFVITNRIYSMDKLDDLTEMSQLFTALEVDPLYKHLCHQQQCFRARLTPKPWRINIERPPNRYPRSERRKINDFEKWLRGYKRESTSKTAVKLLKTFGNTQPHPEVRKVLEVHDKLALNQHKELA